jgi:acyl-CoA synthetase (AMP-forming)/AMP-acid ligase II
MLYEQLAENARRFGQSECISYQNKALTYRALFDYARVVSEILEDCRVPRIGLYLPDCPALVALLAAADHLGLEAYLLHRDQPQSEVHRFLDEWDIPVCFTDTDTTPAPESRFQPIPSLLSPMTPEAAPDAQRPPRQEGRVMLLTSGTTGSPKAVVHTWKRLSGSVRQQARFEGTRWLLLYNLTRFAGTQVFLQAIMNGGRLTIPGDRSTAGLLSLMKEEGINQVSATPTFWRMFLFDTKPQQRQELALTQITLGGEAAPQALLNSMKRNFPFSRITHTFASTEAGFCFSASDGLEGYPIGAIEQNGRGVRFKLDDGELLISSPQAMQDYLTAPQHRSEWIFTGDLFEKKNGRLIYLGRRMEGINVGGNNVHPAEVEDEIRRVPGVVDVKVYGKRSSFTGQVVKADLIPANGDDLTDLRKRILQHCSQHLERHKVPALINFVSEFAVTPGGKIDRRNE